MKNTNKIHKEKLTISDKIGIWIANKVGTMSCFIIFCILAFISFPAALKSHDIITIVSWIAQTFLQLVLLSLLQISSNRQSQHSEIMAEVDYEINLKAEKEIEELKTLIKEDKKLTEEVKKLTAEIKELIQKSQ